MYKIKIYQTDAKWRFEGWNYAISNEFNRGDYDLVFDKYVYDDVTLDDIYLQLNEHHPNNMRSPSISDVFVINNTTTQAYYVDRIGYERIDRHWF